MVGGCDSWPPQQDLVVAVMWFRPRGGVSGTELGTGPQPSKPDFSICQSCSRYHIEIFLDCKKWRCAYVRKTVVILLETHHKYVAMKLYWNLLLHTALVHFPAIIKYLTRNNLKGGCILTDIGKVLFPCGKRYNNRNMRWLVTPCL